jgi:hypothetical protein
MWAVLVAKEERPDILNQKHWDWKLPWKLYYVFPLHLVPRSWNAWISEDKPIKLLGTERVQDNIDVPEPGKWVLGTMGGLVGVIWLGLSIYLFFGHGLILPPPLHYSISRWGKLVRLSVMRYDFNDRYYTGPAFAWKDHE